MRGATPAADPRRSCAQLLHLYDSSGAEWQLGKTKVSERSCLETNVRRIQVMSKLRSFTPLFWAI